MILVVGLGDLVARIRLPALVAIMIMVSIWQPSHGRRSRAMQVHSAVVTGLCWRPVVTVVYTHNLAIGVLVGVLLSRHLLCRQDRTAVPHLLDHLFPWMAAPATYVMRRAAVLRSARIFTDAFDFREARN